jgi:hypothetical protein
MPAIHPASVSILMPCLNALPYLDEAISSVLGELPVLELLVADGGSTDGSVTCLERWQARDKRVKLVSRHDEGPGDALNRAFQHVRGTIVGWLNADDLYLSGAAERAIDALHQHPEWWMVYGDGEHVDASGRPIAPYPTLQPNVGLVGFRDYCFICQPTVFWRRSMGIMLGPFTTELRTAFDLDYWMRAFAAFPGRIGYIATLQAQTRVHPNTISSNQLDQAVLEVTTLQHQFFSDATPHILERHLLNLMSGRTPAPDGRDLSTHVDVLLQQVQGKVPEPELQALRRVLEEANLASCSKPLSPSSGCSAAS